MLAVVFLCWATTIPVARADDAGQKGLSEPQFNEVLDAVQSVYTPVIARRGLESILSRYWSDGQIDARPYLGARFISLSIYGGLARQEGMTQDGLAFIACHELGHPLGGFPSNVTGFSFEGQADYYATTKCLRACSRPMRRALFRGSRRRNRSPCECAGPSIRIPRKAPYALEA